MLYLSLLPTNSKLLSPTSPNLALLGTNLKLELENTAKPFRIYSDYRQPKALAVNNNSKEKEIE